MTILNDSGFAVTIHPGDLRFSAAHFITFDGTCENLHGHNFHVRVHASGQNNADAFVVDFVYLNRVAAQVCDELHDRVLLPGESAEVHIEHADGLTHVRSYDKRFTFPADNCAILPIRNATAEMLAAYLCQRLLDTLGPAGALSHVELLEVAVEEADQQWGISRRRITPGEHADRSPSASAAGAPLGERSPL